MAREPRPLELTKLFPPRPGEPSAPPPEALAGLPAGLVPGARVAYARAWLRACGFLTGPVPFRRGTLAQLRGGGHGSPVVAVVQWDDEPDGQLHGCLACNLWPVDRLHLEPA